MEKAPDDNLEHRQEEEKDYVNIREASRRIGMQNQYASYYLEGIGKRPNLGEGIRWRYRTPGSYHSIIIHKDDVDEFVLRVKKYRGIE